MTQPNTEIAILKERQVQMTQDITEIKADIKEIKTMLNGNFVSQSEYMQYKKDMNQALDMAKKSAYLKLVVTIVMTTIITTLVAYTFHDLLEK